MGKPVIALYIRDKTKQVREKLLIMQHNEATLLKQ